MLLLTSAQDAIHVILDPPVSLDAHASFLDHSGDTVTPGRQNTKTTTEAEVDVVSGPSGSVKRSLKTLHIRNAHATDSTTITVQHKGGGVTSDLREVLLLSGEKLAYTEDQGFRVFSSDGVLK